MHTQTPHIVSALAALAERIIQRRALFLPGGVAEADLDALVDTDEADLHALAGIPAGGHAGWRAKAAVLAYRDLASGRSLGEAALLRSMLADLISSYDGN
jgi:hypothetical protein